MDSPKEQQEITAIKTDVSTNVASIINSIESISSPGGIESSLQCSSKSCDLDQHTRQIDDKEENNEDDNGRLNETSANFNEFVLNKQPTINKFSIKSSYEIEQSELEQYGIKYKQYVDETQMPLIMNLITKDLSEPYSIYTYRYFIHNWPFLCFLAMDEKETECVGAIVCKLDRYKDSMRGYIAMLDVDEKSRRKKIGSNLVTLAIKRMIQNNADEVVLETEVTNKAALRLYENLGFVRDKRLFRYYLNGVEAYRLKLWLK